MEGRTRAVIQAWLLVPASVALLVLALAAGLGFQIAEWAQYVPFVLSLLFLGLPHGALDHLVPARMSVSETARSSTIKVGILYLLLGSLVLVFWTLLPLAAFVFFICLTWYHWGQGDLYALVVLDEATHLRGRWSKALTVLVRGGLPMLVPLVAFPETYLRVLTTTASLFHQETAPLPGAVEAAREAAFVILAVGIVLLFALTATTLGRPSAARSWVKDAAEVLLLTVYFSWVPPILAVGMYFCFWHSLRHIIRLQLMDRSAAAALRIGAPGRAAKIFARDALPVTALALLLLVAAYAFTTDWGIASFEPMPVLGLYLVFLSALTLPHVVIVTVMDLRDELWTTTRTAAR